MMVSMRNAACVAACLAVACGSESGQQGQQAAGATIAPPDLPGAPTSADPSQAVPSAGGDSATSTAPLATADQDPGGGEGVRQGDSPEGPSDGTAPEPMGGAPTMGTQTVAGDGNADMAPPVVADPTMPNGEAADSTSAVEPVDVAVEGPHTYDTFTEGAKAPEYAEGLVYYPTDSDGPFPVMLLSPGFTASNTDYEVWGRVLASHGIVAVLIHPTSTSDPMSARAVDLEAGVGVVRGQLNESGPLAGKIRTDAVGIMGQSMGGGGTLIAANRLGDEIQAAIPLQPYEPGSRFRNITAPTMIIGAERDTVAGVSSNAFTHYNSIPDSTVKIYVEAAGADHFYSTDRNDGNFDINARYAVAFLKVYLEQDMRYEGYLYGAQHEDTAGELSRYLKSQMP